jgi:hypothetical protein
VLGIPGFRLVGIVGKEENAADAGHFGWEGHGILIWLNRGKVVKIHLEMALGSVRRPGPSLRSSLRFGSQGGESLRIVARKTRSNKIPQPVALSKSGCSECGSSRSQFVTSSDRKLVTGSFRSELSRNP